MILTLDTETTIFEKGNPFAPQNTLQCVSWNANSGTYCEPIQYGGGPYQSRLDTIQALVDASTTLVGFNIKFDLHWLRRYGISFDKCNIFDCQLAAFVLAAQRTPYPSLDDVAKRYLDRGKLDVVNNEFWSKGIDTPDIPWEFLMPYAKEDVILTRLLYDKFQEILNQPENWKLKKLLSLQNQDLLTLEEMEWNGMKYDFEKSKQKQKECEDKLDEIYIRLNEYFPNTDINWNSNDDLSCVLYGGTIVNPYQVPDGLYKTGARAGQPRYKRESKETTFPRLVAPLKRSNLAKEGYWSTAEPILKQLKPNRIGKTVISFILDAARIEKLNGTYYKGIPKLAEKMGWEDEMIHGNFNQCVAVTSRLSSSKPNLQNVAGEVDELFITRF
jgi:DNA polymerase I